MNFNKFSNLPYIILIILGFGTGANVYSQTVVQWYTSMGDFRAQLREDLVPMTAQNFINLTNANFYDDLIFHRVIIEFMIQDGCPYGNGTGGPGYTFDDEFHPDLRHDEAGILSMANSGPNTNGSQYFITVVPTDWLDDVHAVFGKIIDGLDVVYAISEVETDGNDKPLVDVVIDSIRVVTGNPSITITGPLPGTKWNSSVSNEITWDSEFIADVKIELSADNGSSWTEIVESTSASHRYFDWAASNLTSTECLIKASDAANPGVYDVMDATFTLCQLDLTSPSGFGFYRVGSPVEISWTSELVGDLTLAFKTSINGDWATIAEGIPASSNSYTWLPEEATTWCKVRIFETAFPEVFDETANYFIVFRLDLLSPQGGEVLLDVDQYDITWESEVITNIKIEFSSDNGQTWSTIAGNVPAGNLLYNWSVPSINADDCFLKLTTPNLPELYSMNDPAFSIVSYTGVPDLLNNDMELAISPNPVMNEAKITYFLSDEWKGTLQAEVYNEMGEKVYSQDLGRAAYGNQSSFLYLPDLTRGLYMIKLVNENNYKTLKFIKK